MADNNINSEQDNAYIASLLERLKQTVESPENQSTEPIPDQDIQEALSKITSQSASLEEDLPEDFEEEIEDEDDSFEDDFQKDSSEDVSDDSTIEIYEENQGESESQNQEIVKEEQPAEDCLPSEQIETQPQVSEEPVFEGFLTIEDSQESIQHSDEDPLTFQSFSYENEEPQESDFTFDNSFLLDESVEENSGDESFVKEEQEETSQDEDLPWDEEETTQTDTSELIDNSVELENSIIDDSNQTNEVDSISEDLPWNDEEESSPQVESQTTQKDTLLDVETQPMDTPTTVLEPSKKGEFEQYTFAIDLGPQTESQNETKSERKNYSRTVSYDEHARKKHPTGRTLLDLEDSFAAFDEETKEENPPTEDDFAKEPIQETIFTSFQVEDSSLSDSNTIPDDTEPSSEQETTLDTSLDSEQKVSDDVFEQLSFTTISQEETMNEETEPRSEQEQTINEADEDPVVIPFAEQKEKEEEKSDTSNEIVPKEKKSFALSDCEIDEISGTIHDRIFKKQIEWGTQDHSEKQKQKWKTENVRNIKLTGIKLAIAIAITVFLTLFELLPKVTNTILSSFLLTRVPAATLLIDLQLVLFICLICYEQILRGIEGFIKKTILPESVLTIFLGMNVIFSIVQYNLFIKDYYLYSCCTAFLACVVLFTDHLRALTLNISMKEFLNPTTFFGGRFKKVSENELISERVPSFKNKKMLETLQVNQSNDFIEQSKVHYENRKATFVTLIISGVSLIATFVVAFVTQLVGNSFEMDILIRSLWLAFTAMTASFSLGVVLNHKMLFFALNKRVQEEKVTIANENVVYEYANAEVFSFEDTEAFPKGCVTLSSIKLCANFRLDKALFVTGSVFDLVGGPLNSIFHISSAEGNPSDYTMVDSIEENGIYARVKGDEVLLGNRQFMESSKVDVFKDLEDEKAESEGCQILYLAVKGLLFAKFHIKYMISESFERHIEYYCKHGIVPIIQTSDPLINKDLINSISYISDYEFKIIRKTVSAINNKEEISSDIGLISRGPRKTLKRMPFFFHYYKKIQKGNIITAIVITSLFAIGIPILYLFNEVMTPWIAVSAQLASALPSVLALILIETLNPDK